MGEENTEKWECEQEHTFDNQTIIITDPCYLRHGHGGLSMDWDDMVEWIKARGLCGRTYYGDWGCTVYETDKPVGDVHEEANKIGEFCADAGMVCVLDREDALKLNPGFDEWATESPFAVTVINCFTGTVKFMVRTYVEKMKIRDKLEDCEFRELRVRGDGDIYGYKSSFESVQTSL